MSKQIDALKLALEALKDNQHLVADNERHAYVMTYNRVIERCEEALAEPEQVSPMSEPNRAIAYAASGKLHELGYRYLNGEWMQTKEPEQGEPNEFLLRGILASELKCWHRLTADEAQNIIHFVQKMGAKLAQPEPVALQDDEIYDAAFSAYCRGEYSRELFRAMWSNYRLTSIGWDRDELKSFARNIAALYTTTPQRKPLSDEEILTYRHMIDWTAEWSYINFARAIEAAHNIKEKNTTP